VLPYYLQLILSVYKIRYGEFNSIKETKQLLVTIMFRITYNIMIVLCFLLHLIIYSLFLKSIDNKFHHAY